MKKDNLKEVGFVRPDVLKEELVESGESKSKIDVIKDALKEELVKSGESKSKIDVIKVVNINPNQEDVVCPSYVTQYYG